MQVIRIYANLYEYVERLYSSGINRNCKGCQLNFLIEMRGKG